jgi:hypothetical protein
MHETGMQGLRASRLSVSAPYAPSQRLDASAPEVGADPKAAVELATPRAIEGSQLGHVRAGTGPHLRRDLLATSATTRVSSCLRLSTLQAVRLYTHSARVSTLQAVNPCAVRTAAP